MRELKFRTWNCLENRYDKNPCAFFSAGGELIPSINRIIEQYTGLKDKNGKEIYEGDVVKCGPYSGKPIVFEEGRYWLGEEPDDLFVATVRWKIEVIGNIHENSELLEGKK